MRLIFLLFVSFALTACGRVGHFDLEAILKDAGFRFEVPVIFEVTDYITEAAQGAEDLADLRAYKFLLERKGKLNECSIVIFDLSSTLPTASEQTAVMLQETFERRLLDSDHVIVDLESRRAGLEKQICEKRWKSICTTQLRDFSIRKENESQLEADFLTAFFLENGSTVDVHFRLLRDIRMPLATEVWCAFNDEAERERLGDEYLSLLGGSISLK